jgi:addiction module RelE/StbE family toxin
VRLRYTSHALADLERLLDDIALQSPQGARRVQARLKAVIDLLTHHPNIGQVTSRAGTRRLVASPYPYLIFYRVDADEVVIHAIRHGARNPRSLRAPDKA